MKLTVELAGLVVTGHHGVEAEERRKGQRFLFDVWLDVSAAALSDRIEDAVDYREVAATVTEVATGRDFNLLEALCGAVAEAVGERFPAERVRVRVRKPELVLGEGLEHSAVTCVLLPPDRRRWKVWPRRQGK